MASVNKVILMGNLGRDPEVRYMPNGEAVANFSIATTEHWKDKSGQRQEKTEWHNIVLYRRLAEVAGEYLKKGSPVYIEGRLQTREWEKDGVKRYTTEVIADSMQLLGGGREDGGSSMSYDDAKKAIDAMSPEERSQLANVVRGRQQQGASSSDYQKASGGGTQRQAPQQRPAGNFDDFDDTIPF